MKNPFKDFSLKKTTAKATSYILGDAHFVLKSTADGCARAEGRIVHKLTGKAKYAIIEDRHNSTEAKQERIKEDYNKTMKNLSLKLGRFKKVRDDSGQTAMDSELNSVI